MSDNNSLERMDATSHTNGRSQKPKTSQNKRTEQGGSLSSKQSKKSDRANGSGRAHKFSPKDAQQRQDEVNQCFHVLSQKSIKLFKKGQYVTSYGLALDIRLPDRFRAKLTLNVPHDYPNSPVKLHYKGNESSKDHSREEKLQTLAKNFNIKARDMLLQKIPIVSQLNYLVYRANVLSEPDFKKINQREQIFYAAFT